VKDVRIPPIYKRVESSRSSRALLVKSMRFWAAMDSRALRIICLPLVPVLLQHCGRLGGLRIASAVAVGLVGAVMAL
jgi:hypothetical protein